MERRVLITGGAGFIGSHLADELLAQGYWVRALDNLAEQVHGKAAKRPNYLDPRVDLLVGDVRDPAAVDRALEGVTSVVHLAAAVGVGQSMYQFREYTEINNLGTAVLLDRIGQRKLDRLVVASSMSVYGEGSYVSAAGVRFDDVERSLPALKRGAWDPTAANGVPLQPVPTRETKPPMLTSVYALSKYGQERLCLMVGRARHLPTVALRLFNTYGPRQALSNPYTGVLAIFGSRLLNGRAPQIFEDGQQRRDFVNVRDVARAFRLALESQHAPFQAINVGSGVSISLAEVAQRLSVALQHSRIGAEITGKHRVGDVRHCFADISRARELLGFEPEVGLDQGLEVLVGWLKGAEALDHSDVARRELELQGLTL